jgi:hypothetical protein
MGWEEIWRDSSSVVGELGLGVTVWNRVAHERGY